MRRTWIRLSALRDPAILSGLVTGDDEWTTSSKLNRDRFIPKPETETLEITGRDEGESW
jgi:hypothetical protein